MVRATAPDYRVITRVQCKKFRQYAEILWLRLMLSEDLYRQCIILALSRNGVKTANKDEYY